MYNSRALEEAKPPKVFVVVTGENPYTKRKRPKLVKSCSVCGTPVSFRASKCLKCSEAAAAKRLSDRLEVARAIVALAARQKEMKQARKGKR